MIMTSAVSQNIAKAIRLETVPALPAFATQVWREIDRDHASVERIVDLVSQDAGLAGKILRVANSALYRRTPEPVAAIRQAVQLIGFNEMRNLCLSLAVAQHFGTQVAPLDVGELWRHSLAVAVAAKAAAGYCRAPACRGMSLDLIYTAGLLHDVGMVVMARNLPEDYCRIVADCRAEGIRLSLQEKAVLGFTHADVGGWLMEQWHLPIEVAEIIRYHHDHEEAEAPTAPYARLLHIADAVCGMYGVGDSVSHEREPFDQSACVELGLQDEDLQVIVEDMNSQIARAELLAGAVQGT